VAADLQDRPLSFREDEDTLPGALVEGSRHARGRRRRSEGCAPIATILRSRSSRIARGISCRSFAQIAQADAFAAPRVPERELAARREEDASRGIERTRRQIRFAELACALERGGHAAALGVDDFDAAAEASEPLTVVADRNVAEFGARPL